MLNLDAMEVNPKAFPPSDWLALIDEDRELREENAKLKAEAAALRKAAEKAYAHASIHSSGVARDVCTAITAALSGDAGKKLLREHAELVEWAKEVAEHWCLKLPEWLSE